MLYESDEDGKYKLTRAEYSAVLSMMCVVDIMVHESTRLEERIKLLPYGLRDYKMIIKRLEQLAEDILSTVPIKRLRAIREELKYMEIRATLKGVTGDKGGGIVCVNTDELMAVIDEIVSMRCLLCEKRGKDIKRCKYLHIIEDCLGYAHDPREDPADGSCQFAGRITLAEE